MSAASPPSGTDEITITCSATELGRALGAMEYLLYGREVIFEGPASTPDLRAAFGAIRRALGMPELSG